MLGIILGESNTKRLQDISTDFSRREPTLKDVSAGLATSWDGLSRRDSLLYSLVLLERISKGEGNSDDQIPDAKTLVTVISMDLALHSSNQSPDAEDPRESQEIQALTIEVALACLELLATSWNCCLDDRTLVSITAYAHPRDPWTTDEASQLASRLLTTMLPEEKLANFVKESILQEYLRPMFSKSTTKVSTSGRPSRVSAPVPNTHHGLEPPLWKRKGPQVISVFRWAVEASDEALVRDNWPLFTPVLLTVVDDEDISTRTTGLEILVAFLEKCPSHVLQSTGIETVFQDGIFPSLLYLPSLNTEEESTRMMRQAYRALIELATKGRGFHSLARRRFLDKIFRDGIFTAYDHAGQYMAIVEVLMSTTIVLLDCLGIFSVKHLPSLLSIISAVMTDPFVISCPSAATVTTKALNATIINCWPRISEGGYEGEVMRIAATCWSNLCDGDLDSQSTNDIGPLTGELRQTGKLLQSIRQSRGSEPPFALDQVLKQDPRLNELFSPSHA